MTRQKGGHWAAEDDRIGHFYPTGYRRAVCGAPVIIPRFRWPATWRCALCCDLAGLHVREAIRRYPPASVHPQVE